MDSGAVEGVKRGIGEIEEFRTFNQFTPSSSAAVLLCMMIAACSTVQRGAAVRLRVIGTLSISGSIGVLLVSFFLFGLANSFVLESAQNLIIDLNNTALTEGQIVFTDAAWLVGAF